MQRLLTGIKATGNFHLGNYFSAIAPMLERQEKYEPYLFIADLHSLNTMTDPAQLKSSILEIAKTYLVAGIDPDKTTMYQQSALPSSNLATILGAQVGLGLLERAHAYKDAKAKSAPINFGLFSYPVLMAADILLFQADIVPVGKDQQQHLEMTREIAERFNHLYGQTFTLPQALISDIPVIPGLDGRKMSKSYNNTIGIYDDPDTIRAKCAKIVTDSKTPAEPKDPAQDTIAMLYKLVATPEQYQELEHQYQEGGLSYKEAKERLMVALIQFTTPLRECKAQYDANPDQVIEILEAGAERAGALANQTLQTVKTKVGLLLK